MAKAKTTAKATNAAKATTAKAKAATKAKPAKAPATKPDSEKSADLRRQVKKLAADLAAARAELRGLLPQRKRLPSNDLVKVRAVYYDPFTEEETALVNCRSTARLYRRGNELYAPGDVIPTGGVLLEGAKPVRLVREREKVKKVSERLSGREWVAYNAAWLQSHDGIMPSDVANEVVSEIVYSLRDSRGNRLSEKRRDALRKKASEAIYAQSAYNLFALLFPLAARGQTYETMDWRPWDRLASALEAEAKREKKPQGPLPYPRGEWRFYEPEREGLMHSRDRLEALADRVKRLQPKLTALGRSRAKAIERWAKDPTSAPYWLCGNRECDVSTLDLWLDLDDAALVRQIEDLCPAPTEEIPF